MIMKIVNEQTGKYQKECEVIVKRIYDYNNPPLRLDGFVSAIMAVGVAAIALEIATSSLADAGLLNKSNGSIENGKET